MTLSTNPDARKALIERLQAERRVARNAALCNEGACFAPGRWREWERVLGEAATALSAPSEEGRWIPVSERVPPINQPVITYAPDCEPYYRTNVDAWSGEDWNDHCVPVTHWAALPAPPADAEKRKR